jgi:hypothetical protein
VIPARRWPSPLCIATITSPAITDLADQFDVSRKFVYLPAAKECKIVRCELPALKVGPYLFLTSPGAPMVECGFRLEKAIADRAIPIVVGYANGNIGYICTAQAHKEGGFEPTYSDSGPGAEAILIAESLRLADRVICDVSIPSHRPSRSGRRASNCEESFAPGPLPRGRGAGGEGSVPPTEPSEHPSTHLLAKIANAAIMTPCQHAISTSRIISTISSKGRFPPAVTRTPAKSSARRCASWKRKKKNAKPN